MQLRKKNIVDRRIPKNNIRPIESDTRIDKKKSARKCFLKNDQIDFSL